MYFPPQCPRTRKTLNGANVFHFKWDYPPLNICWILQNVVGVVFINFLMYTCMRSLWHILTLGSTIFSLVICGRNSRYCHAFANTCTVRLFKVFFASLLWTAYLYLTVALWGPVKQYQQENMAFRNQTFEKLTQFSLKLETHQAY